MPRVYPTVAGIDGFTGPSRQLVTPFGEPLTTQLQTVFAVRPTWGLSTLRDEVTLTGSGAVAEADGQLVVQSGTTPGSTAELRTRERGQYVPGASAQVGVGIETAGPLTGDQTIELGLITDDDGLGFIINDDGLLPVFRSGGDETIITDPNGPAASGNFDLTKGVILQIDFTWYGHGPIVWTVLVDTGLTRRMEVLHIQRIDGLSIRDPNQPITVMVDNGSTSGDVVARIGGRKFSTTRMEGNPERETTEALDYTTTVGAGAAFEPVLAVRPKATFNGNPNSVRSVLERFEISTTEDIEYRWLYDATLSAVPAFATARDVDPTESAVEFARVVDGTITVSDVGRAIRRGYILSGGRGNSVETVARGARLPLGTGAVAVLGIRPITSDANVFVSATIAEQW